MKRSSITTKGFTLVETMIAIAILMLAILGPLTIAAAGLRNSLYAKDEITAYYLAQEGIEYVRAIRDWNYFDNNSSWLDGLTACIDSPGNQHGCAIDGYTWIMSGDANVVECSSASCNEGVLYLTANEDYTHESSGNTVSRFKRYIKIDLANLSTPDDVKVTSTVVWTTPGGGTRTFPLSVVISNIYKDLII